MTVNFTQSSNTRPPVVPEEIPKEVEQKDEEKKQSETEKKTTILDEGKIQTIKGDPRKNTLRTQEK